MSQPELLPANRSTYFIDVVLPLAIAKTYTYRVPYELNDQLQIGVRVIVQFGKNKIYSAIIKSISRQAPQNYEAKFILDIIDLNPLVNSLQLSLWDWIAEYYMCYTGEVMQAALPAALKMASETKIMASSNPDLDRSQLSDKAYMIIEALDLAGILTVNDVIKILGQKSVFPLLKSLFEKGFILISEEIKQRYKAKTKSFLKLNPEYENDESKKVLLNSLNRASKQQDALITIMQLQKRQAEISRSDVLEASGCGHSAIKALVDKEILILEEKTVSRFDGTDVLLTANFTFSQSQQRAFEEINKLHLEKNVVLLHGVTASGKTQVYIRLIEEIIEQGKTALYLLPEIALTAQITERLRLHFGDKLGVYHSKFNDNERAEVWQKVGDGDFQIIIGARSSVFLPFRALGLIIIDEEHENSFKQYDPAPRYHARDTALYLANLHNAKVLLGSATPSVESYFNAKSGKYGLVEMFERFGDAKLPSIQVLDIAKAAREEDMFSYFSGTLLREIRDTILKKEQVILFQNRRGHTPFIQCGTCGVVAKCVNCDVSLTFHKSSNLLHCHYCGFSEHVIETCQACGMPNMQSKGFGTERVEEELEILLPDIRIGRLDLDSTKGKHGFEKVITAFDNQEYDVLIGTQMITKGLDFGNVSLIGVINADGIINFPDFRAYERAFSLFSQVAGRAGRRQKEGKVVIQTYSPNHRVLNQVTNYDYNGMFLTEVTERKNYLYPPFYRLIRLDVKHVNQDLVNDSATRLASILRQHLGSRVLGPEPPLVSRIRNNFIQSISLKIEKKDISINKVKELIKQSILHFELDKRNRGIRIQIDVDPY